MSQNKNQYATNNITKNSVMPMNNLNNRLFLPIIITFPILLSYLWQLDSTLFQHISVCNSSTILWIIKVALPK